MSVIFKTVRYKNFLSTGNVFTEIKLNKDGLTLVSGTNGAGKSTFMDATTFALYGKPFRKINKPQLVNSINQKDCVVEIEFDANNINYKIIRGLKPSIFEIYQNNVLIDQSSVSKDYQEILEKQILKINFKSFCQVIILGSATFQPFMQLAAAQRREIIEDLLDLQIFSVMNILVKEKILKNKDEINKKTNEQVIIEEKIKLVKQHLSEIQNNNEKFIEEKNQRIIDTEKEIVLFQQEAAILQSNIDLLIENNSDETVVSKKIKTLDALKSKIEFNLNKHSNEILFLENNDTCPTCKQSIHQDFKCESINEKTQKAVEINEGLLKLQEQYDTLSNRISEILENNNKLNDIKMKRHITKNRISSLLQYKEQIQTEIDNTLKGIQQNKDNKLEIHENDVDKVKKDVYNLTEYKKILLSVGNLLADGSIKSQIIKQYIPIINKHINKYLSEMDFFVDFTLDELFNETIKSRFRDEFSYASFSEGEKLRINLALLFTWRDVARLRNSVNTNLLILDEVFDASLDQDSSEKVMEIITKLSPNSNIFIISHKDIMVDKFNHTIKFEKIKNFSKIIEE